MAIAEFDIVHQRTDNTFVETNAFNQADPFRTRLSPYKKLAFPTSTYITLQARTANYTPNTLGTTQHIYSTPNYGDIKDLSDYFADWGCSYSVQEGPIHTITIQAPWDTISSTDWDVSLYASEQWEIVPQVGTKNLFYNGLLYNPFALPTATGNYITLPLGLQAAVSVAAKNGNTYLNLTGSSLSNAQKAAYAPFVPWANYMLMYNKMGIEGVPSYTQLLKRTAVIDKNNLNQAFQGLADQTRVSINSQGSVNYICSTKDLIRNYAIPSDTVGQFLLPSYSKGVGVISVDPTVYIAYAGWLIKPPTLQFIGRNKVQLTQEFLWDEWAQGLYYISSPSGDFPLIYTSYRP
jgi:hypothetical protein